MRIGDFDLSKDVMVVAEIGNNHEGSFAVAEEMILRAGEAGVDAVKFQTIVAEKLVFVKQTERVEQLKRFELSYGEYEKLSQVAQKAGVIFLSTPFDLESAEFLNDIVPAFKISSGDNNFYPLITKIAGFGKPIMLSSGLADMDQLRKSKDLIERKWESLGIDPGLAVLHCVSGYPVDRSEANLGAIRQIEEQLGCMVGYSDHTMGIEAAVLSVALGARVVEKHFTIDKNYSDFRDHQLSADPTEMAELVRRIHETREYIGTGQKVLQESEKANESLIRRSVAANRDLEAGARICSDDITWVRPGGGIEPGREDLVIGRELTEPVCRGEMITLESLVVKECV